MVKSNYEFFLVISCKQGEEETEALIEKFQKLIEEHGELESVDKWGKRRLAYPIKKESEGYYVLFTFKSASDFPAELDRRSGIADGVLRSLIVKKEA